MRAPFTTTPGWGHVHPMVPLARAFLERGDEVLWATAAEVCARLEREGFRAATAGLAEREGMERLHRDYPAIADLAPTDRPPVMFASLFGAIRAEPMVEALMPIARDWAPDVIVGDAAEFAAPIVAASLGIPNVTHSFGALLPASRPAAASAAVSPLWEAHGLEPRPYGGSYDHLYLDTYPPSLPSTDRSHVPAIQRLRPVTFATSSDERLPDLVERDPSSPLVYVTFGTVFNEDLSLVATVVDALQPLPVRVIVTLGPRGEPESLGSRPANVCVVRYIPQDRLLPRCAAVVSHSGSGTFLAALARGLPQLCLTQAADQFLNAEAGARSGSALALHPGAVTAETVRSAVGRLLSEAAFRTTAERLSLEIAGMPGPDAVADLIAARFH